ncbi:zf-HC2 domain-containing protein [Cohnella lubricantis]|uniref:Anti-sigma-W factor RsiW n=1 Tax=Cohnella lubricantis TaxID=2163172 RepID=A0A841TM35_9BACL|nr:zf-HC2 domain-containing protein [Cohnella lubricantis]MBB6679591.1 zf-HC2 domain-containing protein [Cohnella lubricantis]MBP2119942.1 anti-sigma factor RsiW [Cohnella lubricantis]
MKDECGLIQERFVDYWEGAADSADRRWIKDHIAVCPNCAEEFRLWEESTKLIRSIQMNDELDVDEAALHAVNRQVMQRIYADQQWSVPLARRSYSFSRAFRLRIGGLLAAIMAIFLSGLLYFTMDRMHSSQASSTGIMEAAGAFHSGSSSSSQLFVEVPVASLSDPIVLRASATMPEYWIALSLLGVMMTLLIMNWFTRVRA